MTKTLGIALRLGRWVVLIAIVVALAAHVSATASAVPSYNYDRSIPNALGAKPSAASSTSLRTVSTWPQPMARVTTTARLAEFLAAKSGTALVPRTSISRHAAEQMAERGITARQVEVAMRQGTRYFDRRNQTFSYVLEGGYASGRSLVVGANTFTGNVTTAIRQSRPFNPDVLLPDGTPRYVLAPR